MSDFILRTLLNGDGITINGGDVDTAAEDALGHDSAGHVHARQSDNLLLELRFLGAALGRGGVCCVAPFSGASFWAARLGWLFHLGFLPHHESPQEG